MYAVKNPSISDANLKCNSVEIWMAEVTADCVRVTLIHGGQYGSAPTLHSYIGQSGLKHK